MVGGRVWGLCVGQRGGRGLVMGGVDTLKAGKERKEV